MTKETRSPAPDPRIDAYIAGFDPPVAERLSALRRIIGEAVPEAVEDFAYRMPAWKLHGKPLAYIAGYKSHAGLYPLPHVLETFAGELASYKTGKGSVQFPHSLPLPGDLVGRMVKARARELHQAQAGGTRP